MTDKDGTELREGREIPFSCRVHEKVFLNLGEADVGEKVEDAASATEAPLASDANKGEEGDRMKAGGSRGGRGGYGSLRGLRERTHSSSSLLRGRGYWVLGGGGTPPARSQRHLRGASGGQLHLDEDEDEDDYLDDFYD